MSALPPLPLNADGSLSIDHSGWVEHMMGCSRHLQYLSLAKRRSARESAAPSFGQAVHRALEMRYRRLRDQGVLNDVAWWGEVGAMLREHFAAHPAGEDFRNETWATTVLERYHQKYPKEPWQIDTVEKPFELPFFEYDLPAGTSVRYGDAPVTKWPGGKLQVRYMGRIDVRMRMDGLRWVTDHKTKTQLGPQFWKEMKMSSQLRGYAWSDEQIYGQKVDGYVVNAIRVKEPPKDPNNRMTPAKWNQWWDESLQRERYLLQTGELEEWKHNTITLCKRFFRSYLEGELPMSTNCCMARWKCEFYEVCEMRASDREEMLASGLYTDNNWSPLQVKETSE